MVMKSWIDNVQAKVRRILERLCKPREESKVGKQSEARPKKRPRRPVDSEADT
jgi:hypothetical protein